MLRTIWRNPLPLRAFERIRDGSLSYPVGLFVFLRLWTIIWASLGHSWLPVDPAKINQYYGMPPVDDRSFGWLWAPWQRWDSIWYTAIATRGYSPHDLSTAFFPLYPFMIRGVVAFSGMNEVAAGLIISTVATLAALQLFYRLTRVEFGDESARRALLYLATFPTAFFLFAAYTESLFLFLALAAWWCARERRWEYAGTAGGLAALARPQGLLLVLPLTLEFFIQYRRGQVSIPRALNMLMVVGSAFIFVLYLFQVTGSPSAWLAIEALWRQSALPWEPLWSSLEIILRSSDVAVISLNVLDLGLTLSFLAVLVWMVRQRRLPEALFLAIILMPPLFSIARFNPYLPLASISRFLVVVFPAFAMLGSIQLREPLPKAVAGLALLLQTCLLLLFTKWIFVG